MSSRTKQEMELTLSIAAERPHVVMAYTSWPYYMTRLERSEGFELSRASGEPGERAIEGILDISSYRYMWLRKELGSEQARAEFSRRRAELPGAPERTQSDYRPQAGERETSFLACAADPYWLEIETDAATWLRRLDAHPFAVCVAQTDYADDESVLRRYLLPRALLTIRRSRPQYSEEYRQQLRERLAAHRPA